MAITRPLTAADIEYLRDKAPIEMVSTRSIKKLMTEVILNTIWISFI